MIYYLIKFSRVLIICTLLFIKVVTAESLPQSGFIPTHSKYASWVFSGVVFNEAKESYGYFFQVQRKDDQYTVIAALMDGQSNKVLLMDEAQATLPEQSLYDLKIGNAFLRFNVINNSWIFGVQAKKEGGFNFKVDMLNPLEAKPVTQDLKKGMKLLITQTSQLNGHVQIGKEEQFVTAKHAWFRQISLANPNESVEPYTGVFCRFNDGSGFYSVNLEERDALRGAVAGWCNAEGIPGTISQFIRVKHSAEGPWHIRVPSPSLDLVLSDYVKRNSLVAGFLQNKKYPGFCVLSNEG